MGQKPKTPSQKQDVTGNSKRRFIRDMLFVALAMAFIVGSAGLFWYFNNRALPNVTVGSLHVGGAAEDQIKQTIKQLTGTKLTLIDGNDTRTVPLSDIGVTVDVDATLNKVMQARRTDDT